MYLFTVEGGDGSGKGLATQMIAEILEQEFTFSGVDVTAEPRRDAELGLLAVEAVRTGEAGPVREAVYFAADRMDHSHTWIRPRLSQGRAVVSERNVHSSLVYQGVVGDLGIEEVARMNAAAMIPDLCIWVDCEPDAALRRIEQDTLRVTLDKSEYFETDKYQIQIRQGYHDLLGGKVPMPSPFDQGKVVGPLVNDGTKGDLRKKLQYEIRRFLHDRPTPLNVHPEEVEQYMLAQALNFQKGQTTLDVLSTKPARSNLNWLGDSKPWEVIRDASKLYLEAIQASDAPPRMDAPNQPLSHPVISIIGTLSLLPGAEISELRKCLGPVRMVTERHTHRMIKFFHEQSGWVWVHKPLIGHDARRTELRSDWQAFGRLGLVIWPLKENLSDWRKRNPSKSWKHSFGAVLSSSPEHTQDCINRLKILGPGKEGVLLPSTHSELLAWWRDGV
ncbi:MAG: dTMP kinase [Euryarchaeota archaeon]|nr:dTMP kinase [Euryarchaeota archaeon]MED5486999.1 dTMP kinase [Candidatus Thermoplasmatota archaeon]|tara:strand:- start:524 stop:1861 length:1338 start_codon:yes stop_codon:yes gene_type:complete